jgi:hypothetical protein
VANSLLFPVVSTIQPPGVGHGHEQHAPDPRLEVLVGQTPVGAQDIGASIPARHTVGFLDGDGQQIDAEVLGQVGRITSP